MPTEAELNAQHAAGSAIAAFQLAQLSFSALVRNSIVSKSEAEEMLRQLIAVNRTGGPGNLLAAQLLAGILQKLAEFQPATRQ
jgi:hypothetical protein